MIDRLGRLRGNLIAVSDVLLLRMRPQRILELGSVEPKWHQRMVDLTKSPLMTTEGFAPGVLGRALSTKEAFASIK